MHVKIIVRLFVIVGLSFLFRNSLAEPFTALFLDVSLNQHKQNRTELVLQTNTGDLFVSESALKDWNFKPTSAKPFQYEGISYYSLKNFPGVIPQVNTAQSSIDITIPSAVLKETKLNISERIQSHDAMPQTRGGFFNYDLSATRAGSVSQSGGMFEAGIFNSYGAGTMSFLAQQGTAQKRLTRLQTSWAYDDLHHMRTLRLGDAVSQTPVWSQGVLFGGVQWGTNFDTQPGFVRYPLPNTQGAAVIPSSVDLYVNNSLLSQQQVRPGPFSINNIPVITGGGVLQVVTTDLLGRQQITSVPFYTSPTLLKAGLHNYTFSAGLIRNNYGTDSNNYSQPMVSGGDMIGFSDTFTGQWYGEILKGQQMGGVGGNFATFPWGIFNASVAGSRADNRGTGILGQVGWQRQMPKKINFGLNAQLTTSQFIRMGMSSTQFLPSLQAQAFVGIPLKDGTSVGVSYTQQNNRDTPNNRLVSVNYGRTVAKHVFLSVSGIMNIGGQPTKSVFLNLSFPLDARTSVNASATKQQNLTQGAVQVTRSLPADIGYGYSVRATQNQGQGQDYQATVSAQNSIGTYTAQAEQQFGQQNYRAGIRGGVALMGGDMYLSRQITGSFGVVQVPGHENVGVYAFNRLVARTNRKGNALIPNLLPYQPNPIRIDPTDLPMDAHINETELNPVPRYKSGVLLQFSAKTSKGALIKLVQASGAPVPLGAMVQFVDVPSEEFPVASEGETYLIGLKPGAHTVKAAWDDEHSCIAEINYPETNEMVPDLGEALCR